MTYMVQASVIVFILRKVPRATCSLRTFVVAPIS